MSSPIYQYVINLIMSFPIRRGPGVFMDSMVSQSLWKEHGYRHTRWVGQVERHYELGYGVYPAQFRMLHLVSRVQRHPFIRARKPKAAINFPGHKCAVISRLKEAGLRVCHAELKDLFTDEHKSYHLAPAESKVDHPSARVIFSDESTFSTANSGLVLVYRPWGERTFLTVCQHLLAVG
jgi:hypothetical protein